MFSPERVRDKDLSENGVSAHNCTRKRQTFVNRGLYRADPRLCGLFLSGLLVRPPNLPTAASPCPHSFSFTVTKSPRKETLSAEVERRLLPAWSSGAGPAVGTFRRTASGP